MVHCVDPSNHLATIHQRHRHTGQRGRWSDSVGRTVLQTVAQKINKTRMWADAQRDGHLGKYRWRPLFHTAKFG